ncbi:MAG: hypothetical protein IPO62_12920 [Saprospiraceae bacterium]|nr:hypothetical protein [Saprospiraceae bacterium]
MAKCKLCLIGEITGIKSHIFTDSLIRSAIYIEGKTKRGNQEAMANISIEDIRYVYFGQDVLPEKRTELLGKIQDEIELEKTKNNPLINDRLVCNACENRFVQIESEFMQKIYSPILAKRILPKNDFFEFKGNLSLVSLGFILINVWRASASKFNDWQLPLGDEENIRNVLNNCLDKTLNDSLDCFKSNIEKLKPYTYHLSFLEQSSGSPSENIVLIDEIANPYYFHLNRMTLFLSIDSFNSISIPNHLEKIYDKVNFLKSSINFEVVKIGLISNESRFKLLKTFFGRLSNNIMEHIVKTFVYGFYNFFGFYPNEIHIEILRVELVNYLENSKPITIPGIVHTMAIAMDKIVTEAPGN